MSNENKKDWNDLENEQAYTNAWQIDKIWEMVKKMPIYFWVVFVAVLCLLANNFRLVESNKANAVDQMMLQAYSTIALNVAPMNLQQFIGHASDEQWIHYTKTAVDRDSDKVVEVVRGIPELMKINDVAEIVNAYVKDRNEEELVIAKLQKQLQSARISRQFYLATSLELSGEAKKIIDFQLNRMFTTDYERALSVSEHFVEKSADMGAEYCSEQIALRIELVKDKDKFLRIAAKAKLLMDIKN